MYTTSGDAGYTPPPAPQPKPRRPAPARPAPVSAPSSGSGPTTPGMAVAGAQEATGNALEQLFGFLAKQPAFDPSAVRDARYDLSDALNPPETEPFVPASGVGGVAEGYMVDAMTRDAQDAAVDSAQAKLEEALRAQRMHAIGSDKANAGKPDVNRMTQAAYDQLTPLQRSAVDFNTNLVRAVRKDRKLQDEYAPTDQQMATYDKDVEKMFGPDGTSDLYAPETMAVLRQIDFHDDSAALDDFLSLDAAIHARDLKDLGPLKTVINPATPPAKARRREDVPLENAATDRSDLMYGLARNTQSMEHALVRGNQMLQSIQAVAAVERNDDLGFIGGVANEPPTMPGYGSSDKDAYYQKAFDMLAAKDADKDAILAALNTDLHPDQFQEFLAYADNRSANAERYHIGLGATEGVDYRTPEQFRKLLGLDGGGGNDDSNRS